MPRYHHAADRPFDPGAHHLCHTDGRLSGAQNDSASAAYRQDGTLQRPGRMPALYSSMEGAQ
ncbi:hypothetical protein GCM10008955_10350 [Deinococcus malanensis]|uniref:Uncharacterized protein n=1 Tax=Deinococcus malanensis TaxID=1706855 RepID=A0ABQ2ERL9_9DEIO|nr:hypothetical protein GCM10008955_10350 [Deinococcus malanensis]